MTDMESMDRAVEEARARIIHAADELVALAAQEYDSGAGWDSFTEELDALIEAVSAKARAEERERIYEEQRAQSKTWPIPGADVTATVAIPWNTFPARSSEEAGG